MNRVPIAFPFGVFLSQKRRQKEARRAVRKDAQRSKQQARTRRDAQGRTHLLVVHPDRAPGAGRLSLARAIFEEAWQNQVATAAANTADGFLSEAHTVAQAAALGRNAMAGVSTIVDGGLARVRDHLPALACRPGCAHCCYQAVGVSPPEVFAIHEHLLATRSPAEMEAVATRIRAADDRTRPLSPDDRQSPDLPCPFLDESRCTIYEVRPLACRGANSLDASACERTLHDPAARAALRAGAQSIPCYREPILAFHAVAAGVQLALHEAHALAILPLDLDGRDARVAGRSPGCGDGLAGGRRPVCRSPRRRQHRRPRVGRGQRAKGGVSPEPTPGGQSRCAPGSFPRSRLNVPSGRCPAARATSSTKQSENPKRGFRRKCSSAARTTSASATESASWLSNISTAIAMSPGPSS